MYADSIIKKYIDLLKAKNGEIKTYYQSDPIKVPTINLPCCIIAKTETQVRPINSAEDEHIIGLQFTIITDIRKELSTDESLGQITPGVASLYDIVEGRNPDDHTLKDTSLLDILRTNIIIDATKNLRTDLGTITRIDYGQTLRSRSPEMWSTEARIDITAHFIQAR